MGMKRATVWFGGWVLLVVLLLLMAHWRLALKAHSGQSSNQDQFPQRLVKALVDRHPLDGAVLAVEQPGSSPDLHDTGGAGFGATLQHRVHSKAERATNKGLGDGTGSSNSSSISSSSTSGSGSGITASGVSEGGAAAARPSILAPVLAARERAAKDPAYRETLRQAAARPINIAVMTSLFWALPVEGTKNCSVDGIPLDCHIQNGGTAEFLDKADALYYHVPSFGGRPRAKAFPEQLRLAMSLESAAYYPALDDPKFMCHFDAEMTYRTCAQVTNWYSLEAFDKLFKVKPLPFEEKLHAIAYINSNCGAQSGRSDIMRKLVALGNKSKVPVHALGHCDHNTEWPQGNPGKVDVMHKYKFCVAMENSVRQDYMTEKVWDALMAGCVPIYLGSANTREIIPDPDSIIVYDPTGKGGHASTPEQLDQVMHEIGSNKTRYEAMVAWKHRQPEEQPSEIFRYLWQVRQTSGECFLCQFLARHRAEPQPHYATCLFNKQWMSSAGQTFVPEEQACPSQGPVNPTR